MISKTYSSKVKLWDYWESMEFSFLTNKNNIQGKLLTKLCSTDKK